MCLNPILLPNGQEVACHQCWQCVRRRIDDWQGRCIAESLTSRAAHAVTLTYGRDRLYGAADHLQAAVLTYSDVQAFLKHLRGYGVRSKKRYPVRYLVCGEYGSRLGRAHWHCLLFWQEGVPDVERLGKSVDHEAWPHGHTYWQTMTPETVRYVTKYVAKEVTTEDRQYHLGLSTRPPLGDQYFRQLAAEYVEARLAPQDFFYSFPEIRDEKNRQKKFQLQGRSRQNFLKYFTALWTDKWGDHAPNSDIVEGYEDAIALRENVSWAPTPFTGAVKKPKNSDLRSWMTPDRLRFDEKLNVWTYEHHGDQGRWFWSTDSQGVTAWRGRIGVRAFNDHRSYREASRGA